MSLDLLPQQKEALARSKDESGFAWFMEPGMGKTLVALTEFQTSGLPVMLVVCPNPLKSNWMAEAEKYGVKHKVVEWPETLEDGIILVNYEKLVQPSAVQLLCDFVSERGVYAVADESHRIKNPKSITSRALIRIFDQCTTTRVMTGTPMTQNVMDLWPQLRAVRQNGRHTTPWTFRNRYALMGGFMAKQVVGIRNEEELRAVLSQVSFQAKKSEYMKYLPPKVYKTIGYEMGANQKKAYDKIIREKILELSGVEITAPMAITAMIKAQQISSGFILTEEGATVQIVKPENNPKIQSVLETIEDIDGKIILFTVFKYTTRALEMMLPNSVVIRGGMTQDEVSISRDRFNNDPSIKYLVAQVSSGKQGFTFLGTEDAKCSTTIFVENSYSLGDRIQAEDRNHRHGQTSEQVTYYDVVGSSMDRRVVKALQNKSDIIKAIMGS